MLKPISLYIGLRYTGAKRRNHVISFISLVSVLGLALGIAVLIVVFSVMSGFERELQNRILGMLPHARISAYEPIRDWQTLAKTASNHDDVLAVAPLSELQGMLTYQGNVHGIMVHGIEPEYEKAVSIVNDFMTYGDITDLKAGEYGIVLGHALAGYFGLLPGDKVTLVMPEASVSAAGVVPRFKRFVLVGTFKVGAEMDSGMAFIHLSNAGKLLRQPGTVQSLRLKINDLFDAERIVWEVIGSLGGIYRGSDWTGSHGNLFYAIKMEKAMMGLLLFFIVAVAAFNIISSLVMLVTDKQSDIAVLRTLGASSKTVMRIFMVQGIVIGLMGTLLGAGLGILLALTISDIAAWVDGLLGTPLLAGYFVNYLPSQLLLEDVVLISSSAFILSFLATIYPAYRAAKVEPAEALRYE